MKEWHIRRWIGAAAALILSGIYLTWMIDRVTLSTWLQRTFIFVYFVAGAAMLLFLRKCFWTRKKSGQRRMILVCSVIGAALSIFFCKDIILPQSNSAQLELMNISQRNQNQGNEVWLISLKLDGAEIPLSSLTALENNGWIYSDANDDFYCTGTGENNLLLQLPAHRDAELNFITSSWSGSVEIRYGGGSPQEVSLYDPAGESATLYAVNLHINQATPVWWLVVFCLGALVVISFLFSWAGELYCIYKQKSDAETLEYYSPNRAKLVAIFIASLLIVGSILFQQSGQYASFWITQRDSEVTFINEGKDPNGNASEVWLKLFEGGRQVAPEDILVPTKESGWEIRDGNYLSLTQGAKLTLPCKVPSDVKFMFQSHAWTGKVSIQWEGYADSYNFYSTVGTEETVNAPWLGAEETAYSWVHIGLYVLLGFLAWGLLFWFLVKNHQSAWILLFAISWGAVALVAVDTGRMNGTFMFILALSAGTAVWLQKRPKMMKKYMQGPALIAVLVLSVYFTFALTGNGLFLMEKRMDLSGNTISYFMLLIAALCPSLFFLIAIFEGAIRRAEYLEPVESKQAVRRMGFICFGIVAVILLFFSLGFYPANMSEDGTTHWKQAIGAMELTDGNPVIYALLIRVLSKIAYTPYSYTVFQIILFSIAIGEWGAFLYKKGIHKRYIILLSIAFGIVPNNYMTLTVMSKNPLCAILNLWVLILLVYLLDDAESCTKSWLWFGQIIFASVGLYFIRLNTFPAYYCIIAFFIWVTWRCYCKVKWKLVATVFITMALIWLVKNPLYESYDIVHVSSDSAPSLPCNQFILPLASIRENELYLPEDILGTMEEILPLEEWVWRYNPYHGDSFAYKDPIPNYENRSTAELLRIYLRALSMYPDVVIKDRLDAVESIWNIFPSDAWRAYNQRYYVGIKNWLPNELLPANLQNVEPNAQGYYFLPNAISNVALWIAEFTAKLKILDVFVWRNGIYIVSVLAFFIALCVKKRSELLWIFLPTLSILGTLIAIISWQIYNYIYFFPIATLAFVSCGCVMTHRSVNKTEEGN